MIARHFGAIVVAGVFTLPAAAAISPQASKLSQIDKTFLIDIQQSNIGEVTAANLVKQHSTGPLIASFAQTMIDDHTNAEKNVERFASDVQLTLPVTPAPADAAQIAHLQTLHGRAFDIAYMNEQQAGHRRAVAIARQEVAHGTQRDVAALAQQLLPTIEHHLELVKQNVATLNNPTQSGELKPSR